VNIALPANLEEAMKKQVAAGHYRSIDELVSDAVLRLLRGGLDVAWVEKQLQDGLESESREATDADWQQLRERIEARVSAQ
jgi:Arc/MetJ-type ribon-helix-helix transcriptional regulator